MYLDEFRAYLSDEAKTITADVAKHVRGLGARGLAVQARASATGRADTSKYLAQMRSLIVADQLEANGMARAIIRQQAIE